MNVVDAIIIEDEIAASNLLKYLIQTHCPTISIIGEASNVENGIILINEKQPALIFLDVLLGENYCFEILERIDFKKYKIVFMTAHQEYAITAFRYNVFDYLLKPYSIKELKRLESELMNETEYDDVISKSMYTLDEFQRERQNGFITISSLKQISIVKYAHLMYLKSCGGYTSFFLSSGKEIVGTMNIGEYEVILSKNIFYRTHKSYIVNLDFIEGIDKSNGAECIITNGTHIPIGRRRLDNLLQFFK